MKRRIIMAIDFQNMFADEKNEDIVKLITLIRSIRDLINGDTVVKDLDFGLGKEIATTLDSIISDKQCADVQITTNVDNTLFGVYVNPTISNVDLMDILIGDDPCTINRYRVEIDSKIFSILDPTEIAAYILYNIEATTGEAAIRFIQFYIDKFMTSKEDNIDIKNSINYSNILIFGIKDAIARYADLLCGVGHIESAYLTSIREKVNMCVSGLADATNVSNLGILDWCLLIYTELKTEWRDAVDRMIQAKGLTGSRFRKEEIDKMIKFLQRASMESVNEAVEVELRDQLVNEAKGFSLFRSLKQNGLRSIEDDLYEYKVRAKNCTEQSDAIYILRCINTRMAILQDYLATTPDLKEHEFQRWQDVIEQYRELRAAVAAKKFGSASKNFNSFLTVDYDALDKLDAPKYEAAKESVEEGVLSAFSKQNLSNASIAFKIKPKQNLDESFKKHSYPGLLNFVNTCKSIDNLKYMQKDYSVLKNQLNTILKRIKAVEAGKGDPKWESGIRKLYMDKGITSKDVQAYIDWCANTYYKAISARIAELKKSLKEAGILTEADDDTDEGFEEAPADADTKEDKEEAPAEEENTEEPVEDQPEDEEKKEDIDLDKDQNLSDAEIKSDGGDIYVNCTINK
jgi:hypothetical protein